MLRAHGPFMVPQVVKQPMDLGTIKERLEAGKHYKDVKEVRGATALEQPRHGVRTRAPLAQRC